MLNYTLIGTPVHSFIVGGSSVMILIQGCPHGWRIVETPGGAFRLVIVKFKA